MFRCSGQIRLRLLQLLFEVKYTACLLDFDKVYRKVLYFSIALKSMKIKHVLEILDFCVECWSASNTQRYTESWIDSFKPDFEKEGRMRWYPVENWFNSSQIKWENFQPELDNFNFSKVSILIHFCPLNPDAENPLRYNWLSYFPSDGSEFWSNFLSFSKLQSFLKCLWQKLRDSQGKHQTERPQGNRKHLQEIILHSYIILVQYLVSTEKIMNEKKD